MRLNRKKILKWFKAGNADEKNGMATDYLRMRGCAYVERLLRRCSMCLNAKEAPSYWRV